MIHVSLEGDNDDDAAETWAAEEEMPWLTILPSKVKKSGMRDYKTNNLVPEYHLIDGDGNTIAQGSKQSFAKIAELSE